jgi:tRNA (adenine22-N1)-methyltransferase
LNHESVIAKGARVPKLDARLIAVTQQIRSRTHADIGSDHGGLLVSMLRSGRIDFGIAIEFNQQPFENSTRALIGLPAEVRFGDGLSALQPGEADSLSICGLGAQSILRILTAHPSRVPDHVVVQPNQNPEVVRQWALGNGYHLVDERITSGHRSYTILSFRRAEDLQAIDPAYENVNRQAGLLFGPLILKRQDRRFESQLREEASYWERFDRLEPRRAHRLSLIRAILAEREIDPLDGKKPGLEQAMELHGNTELQPFHRPQNGTPS